MSFAQFLRLQRSCRVRRSGDRGPGGRRWGRGVPIRPCCATAGVQCAQFTPRGHEVTRPGAWMWAAGLCDCMFSQGNRAVPDDLGPHRPATCGSAGTCGPDRTPAGGEGAGDAGERQGVVGRAHLPTTSWTVLEGPCPTASSTCPLQGSGYGAPRQGRTTRSGRHVCALQVLANSGRVPAGTGTGRAQAAGEASTAALIRSRVVRMPAASSWSWPAAPPITGPSTLVSRVPAPDPVPVSS